MAHKAHIKEAMTSTNRKSWEVQIMLLHARKDAMVHATRQLEGMFLFLLSELCFSFFENNWFGLQMRSQRWKTWLEGGNFGLSILKMYDSSRIRLKPGLGHLGGSNLSWSGLGKVKDLFAYVFLQSRQI